MMILIEDVRQWIRTQSPCQCGCGEDAGDFVDELERLYHVMWIKHSVDMTAYPINSLTRCVNHNKASGGSKLSLHPVAVDGGKYGAVDIGLKARARKIGGDARVVLLLVREALALGFNNIEICDGHTHLGIAKPGHAMADKIYWGRSK